MRSAAECLNSGDYVTVYDGANPSTSPILARFCDGPVPDIVSSGGELTVEFRSSTMDTIYSAGGSMANSFMEGFELKIRIETIASDYSTAAAANQQPTTAAAVLCQRNVTSSGLSRGWLTPARRTLPLDTTCHFRWMGRPDERVWIYFTKYYFTGGSLKGTGSGGGGGQCRHATMRLIEGDGGNQTIGVFCRERPPPLCERHLTAVGETRNSTSVPPCRPGVESFVSRGSTLSLQQYLPEGTAFSKWHYAIAYEFVRVGHEKQVLPPLESSASLPSCDRTFSVQQADWRGNVKSPQNVFLFGRGGAKQLRYNSRISWSGLT